MPLPGPPFDGRALAKRLLRTVRAGTLATLGSSGEPFASLVSVATRVDGRPILLLSRLAAHTAHLDHDPRCSLLLAQGGKGDPLAHPRLTLTGWAERLQDGEILAEARARFLARQPKAALYADFPDFGFWQVHPDAAHLNGGFARAATMDSAALLTEAGGLADVERDATSHMNADHRDALALYAEVLADAGSGAWTTSGVDPEGIDLVCGDRVARVEFDEPVTDAVSLRRTLARLADRACLATSKAADSGTEITDDDR